MDENLPEITEEITDLAQLSEVQAMWITTLRDGIDRVSFAAQSGLSAAELRIETLKVMHKLEMLKREEEAQRLRDELVHVQERLNETREALKQARHEASDLRLELELVRIRHEDPRATRSATV